MDDFSLTLLCSIASAGIAWFSAMNTIKKNASDEASEITELKVLIKGQTNLLENLEKKLEKSAEDRRIMHGDMKAYEQQIKTLFENYEDLKERVKYLEDECRKRKGE